MLLVSDILKIKGNAVYTIEKETTVIEALELMVEKNVGALVVMEGSETIGIFSERDFVRAVANDKTLLLKMPVETFMTKEVYSVCKSDTIDECMDFSNLYAPEHLIIATENASKIAGKVKNAGSVFIGSYSCESAGDYASGTNHTLPTNGYAKSYSGVSAESYIKKITFQEVTQSGIKNIGKAIELMAEAEQLIGHRNAVSLRLKSIEDE